MKFKEYQSGGIIYTPFISSRGSATSTGVKPPSLPGTSKDTDKDTDSTSDAIQKEIIKILNENGLENDVAAFLEQANSILASAKQLSTTSLFGGTEDMYTMSHLISVLQLANSVKTNKKDYDDAVTQIKAEKSGWEVALSSDGGIYALDTESESGYNLTVVSPTEYYKNQDKYRAVTNTQLLQLRRTDPSLKYRSDILGDVGGSIGMETVTRQIDETISKFGEISRSEYIKHTGENISQSIWDGMQILIGEGAQGYYKVTTKSERDKLDSAIEYLWRKIDIDGQKKLIAEAAIQGKDPKKHHADIILAALDQQTSFEYTPTFESTMTKSAGIGADAGDSAKLEDDTYLSVIARGKGVRKYYSLIPGELTPDSDQTQYSVVGIPHGPLVDRNGNSIEQTSLPDALRRGEIFRGRPDTNVSFGNKVLSENEIKKVIIDEQPMVDVLWLPYRETLNGVVPDFSMVDVYKEVNKFLEDNPNITDIERRQYVTSKGIDPSKLSINQNGDWYVKTKLFTRVAGYISDDLVELTDSNKRFMDEVSKKDAKEKVNLFNTLLKFGHRNPGKDDTKLDRGWDWFGGGDWDKEDMYRGYIYTTAPDEWISALLTNQNKIDKQILSNIDSRISMLNYQQNSNWDTTF